MKVVWRLRARAELEAIFSHIASESPAGAVRTREQILGMTDLLEMWPDAGKPARRGLRELVVPRSSYVVLYRRSPNVVTIVRVVHAMRRR